MIPVIMPVLAPTPEDLLSYSLLSKTQLQPLLRALSSVWFVWLRILSGAVVPSESPGTGLI